jgi:hypothetical protein
VDTALGVGSVAISMPEILAEAAPDPILAGGAAALGLASVLRTRRREAKEFYARSPAAYLYRIERDIRAPTLLTWLRARLQRFLIGI